MLKKLYKHEFYSLFRNMLPVYIGLIGLALFSRLFFLLDDSIFLIRVIQKSTVTLFVLGTIAMFAIGFVIVVRRFYLNLLSHEGYLTFTLPVRPSQHILCKLICGSVVIILNFFCLLLALLILLAGENLMEGIRIALRVFGEAFDSYGASFALWIVEFVILAIGSLAAGLLMTYVSMAIGQQFKNRIAAAVGAYFAIYAALQTFSVIAMIVVSDIIPETLFNKIWGIALVLGMVIVYQVALALVYFFVTRYLLTRRLNLA